MPELPEVQTVVNTLRPRVVGARICSVAVHRADIVAPKGTDLVGHLTDRSIVGIERRGKRIVFELDNQQRFFIHLGMTGRLTIEPTDAPMVKHTHVVIELRHEGTEARRHEGSGRKHEGKTQISSPSLPLGSVPSSFHLRFRDPRRFGEVVWLGAENPDQNLGPEPLSLTPDELFAALKRTTRFVKTALLDQKLVAGLGNIYVDEALHQAGIYPKLRADRLTRAQVERLTRAIKTVLQRALKHRGSTLRDFVDADGLEGAFQKLHRVYDRAGKPCLNCGEPIKRIVLGGRSTHYCGACQPPRRRFKRGDKK